MPDPVSIAVAGASVVSSPLVALAVLKTQVGAMKEAAAKSEAAVRRELDQVQQQLATLEKDKADASVVAELAKRIDRLDDHLSGQLATITQLLQGLQ